MPDMMFPRGHVYVMSIRPGRPGQPTHHSCPYRISKTDEDMTIKDWKNIWSIVYLEATLGVGQELETGCSPFSIMESQGLSCFMIFYLREGRVGPMREE